MNTETLTLLTALSEKLGTTTEYLWSALLWQAPITGSVHLLLLITLSFGFIYLAKRLHSSKDNIPEDEYFLAMVIVAAFGVFLVLIFAAALPSIIAAFFNPEYWALRQIVS